VEPGERLYVFPGCETQKNATIRALKLKFISYRAMPVAVLSTGGRLICSDLGVCTTFDVRIIN
jgi:hypothetical protein